MRRVVMAGLLMTLMAHVIGAEPLSLRAALQQARQGAGEAVAGRERAQAAAARVQQAKGYRLPSVSLQEIFTRTDSPAEAFALKLNQERFSFPEFMTSDPNQPDPLNTAITRVEAMMPLFTGGELSGRIAQAELGGHGRGWPGALGRRAGGARRGRGVRDGGTGARVRGAAAARLGRPWPPT